MARITAGHGHSQNFGSGGTLRARPRGGVRVAEPPGAGEFSKIFKKYFLRKLLKCIVLAYFSKNVTNHA